ncbi:hypothetical protein ARMSODRAFT_968139 [Armillaria solidipes]|uniref:Uncharacterized protein n=1 Tax=Armillaria solidipes TaxID=1076256 RepID=A0A2H3CRC2_9AGAR|nr:hypothetical protein ARMSODRAFT_968139 [Armillaria solidipes]
MQRHIPTALAFLHSLTLEYRLPNTEKDADFEHNQIIGEHWRMIDPENRRFWAQLRSKWGSKKPKKVTGIMPAGETIDASVSTSMALGILDDQVLYSAEEIYDTEYGARDPYSLPNDGEFLAMTANMAEVLDVSANTEDDKDELYVHENIFKDVLSSQFAGGPSLERRRGLYTIWEENEDVEED